jgi:glycosyltransferase involved in cell wall biosynthesis
LLVSVVTPSFNQARYIERTIESVLSQRGAFDLEYLVVDGASSDGTLDVLRRYDGRLRWLSEPDRGQSDALNKGFRLVHGDVVAWLNSDDTYEPGAIQAAVEALETSGASWAFGQCRFIDEDDREVRRLVSGYKTWVSRRYSYRRLLARNFIPQQACFIRRRLLDQAGPLVDDYHLAMDYDLWLRLGRLAEPVFVPATLANFRWHRGSKTATTFSAGVREALRIASSHARGLERLALLEHAAHLAAQLLVYWTLEHLPPARRGVDGGRGRSVGGPQR